MLITLCREQTQESKPISRLRWGLEEKKMKKGIHAWTLGQSALAAISFTWNWE
jgi:hypothetical protein